MREDQTPDQLTFVVTNVAGEKTLDEDFEEDDGDDEIRTETLPKDIKYVQIKMHA